MNKRIRPFSNGSEYDYWLKRNCENCKLYSAENDDQCVCDIDAALLVAYWDDGTIPYEIWERMGERTGSCSKFDPKPEWQSRSVVEIWVKE